MRRNIIPMLLILASTSVCAGSTPDIAALEQEAQAITQQFGSQLKSVLQATMISGGPIEAMKVCKLNAPEIAAKISLEKGWIVARTSQKIRNPNNRPDQWESQVLAEWADTIAKGTPVQALKKSELVQQEDKAVFRYMQAIPTGDVCLNCHGSHVSDQVRETLKVLYPEDQATGFKMGDLRGAFTLQKTL